MSSVSARRAVAAVLPKVISIKEVVSVFISEIKDILDAETISKVFNIIREAKLFATRISTRVDSESRPQGFEGT